MLSSLDADVVEDGRRAVDHDRNRGSDCIRGPDSHAAVVLDHCIENMRGGRCSLVQRNVNAVRGEAKNVATFNIQVLTRKETDAVDAGSDAIEPQVAQDHNVIWAGLDHDPVSAGDQD